MKIAEAFSNVADSIAQLNPEQILQIKAPEAMSLRVEELVNKRKNEQITTDESIELEQFLALNMFISLTKARARALLAS